VLENVAVTLLPNVSHNVICLCEAICVPDGFQTVHKFGCDVIHEVNLQISIPQITCTI
jgi:hypothetical protein